MACLCAAPTLAPDGVWCEASSSQEVQAEEPLKLETVQGVLFMEFFAGEAGL